MVLGEVIGKIENALVPANQEVTCVTAILNPEATHGHGFGVMKLDGAISDASSRGVVSLDGSRAMRKTEFFKGDAKGFSFAAVVEQTT